MKQAILIFFTVSLVVACSTSSDDQSALCPSGENQAKLIRQGCEAYVFQLIQPSALTQAEWKDIFTKKEYTNVLSVLNYCDDTPESKMLQSLSTGDVVTMTLTPTTERCLNLCFAFEDAPGKAYKASAIALCTQ